MRSAENLESCPTSVIILTRDEGPVYHQVLSRLQSQTFQNFELVVVDNASQDGTNTLAYKYFDGERIKLAHLPDGQFTHPLACNLGASISEGRFLVYINGHAIPVSDTWLSDGLSNFSDENVAGVFAYPLAHRDAPLTERLAYYLVSLRHNKRRVYTEPIMGILGNTNSIIRKELWDEHHFDSRYAIGGEDGEWARYWLDKGKVIIEDPKFRVYHSHYLTIPGLIRQYLWWRRVVEPSIGLDITRGRDF